MRRQLYGGALSDPLTAENRVPLLEQVLRPLDVLSILPRQEAERRLAELPFVPERALHGNA